MEQWEIAKANAALRKAVDANDAVAIRAAIGSGADVNHRDPQSGRESALLHWAANHGFRDAIEALVEAGADLGARDTFDQIPLDIAIQFGPRSECEEFSIWLADLTGALAPTSGRAVASAAERGLVGLVDKLVALGCPIQSLGTGNRMGLLAPAWSGSVEGARKLLELGADIEQTGDYEYTALHEACNRGNTGVARLLLEAGANPNAQQRAGYTPLHLACEGDFVEIARALMDAGADPLIRNNYEKSVPERALESGATKILALMEEAGFAAPMNQEQLDDALAFAAKKGQTDMVRRLLNQGADPTVKVNGRSLLQHAKSEAVEVKQLILAARAGNLIEAQLDGAQVESSASRRQPSLAL